MLYHEVVEKIRKQFSKTDVSNYEGKLALQFNLTGKVGENGWFYVEILDGVLSIEPYTYDDRDAEITISGEDLIKIIEGNLDPVLAAASGKLKLQGDKGKALQINMFAKQIKAAKIEEKKAEKSNKKNEAKKAEPKKAIEKKEVKPAIKKEAKTEVKQEVKADAKPEVKAEEIKADAKTEVKATESKVTAPAKNEVKSSKKK